MVERDPPVSVRPGAVRLGMIDAFAERVGMSRHAAMMALIDDGLLAQEAPQAGKKREVAAVAGLSKVATVAARESAKASARMAENLKKGAVRPASELPAKSVDVSKLDLPVGPVRGALPKAEKGRKGR